MIYAVLVFLQMDFFTQGKGTWIQCSGLPITEMDRLDSILFRVELVPSGDLRLKMRHSPYSGFIVGETKMSGLWPRFNRPITVWCYESS